MIKLQTIGHLGRDAVVNNVNGKPVINFSVAHTTSYTDNAGQKKEVTMWVDCSYWTERTNVAQYLKKGTQVYVEGSPAVGTYDNAQGAKIPQLRLRVASIQLLSSGNKNEQPQQPNAPGTAPHITAGTATEQGFEDDLPF